MNHEICLSCETVRHCSQHGCIPLQPAPVLSAGPITPEMLRPWTASERSALVAVLEKHGIIEPQPLKPQPLKPCRSPYCECTPGTCSHPGCYDARGEPFEHPAPVQEPYTVVRNAWTGKATYTCNTCGETDFRSEHAARFHICEPPAQPTPATKPTLRVYGWVWKHDRGDGVYEPSYTPAQHVQRGELFALVDPNDLHQPLENTDWFAPQKQIADPCPGCTPGHVCRTPACGRLQLPQSHPLRNTQ